MRGKDLPCPLCRQNIDIKEIKDKCGIDIDEFIKFKGVRMTKNMNCLLEIKGGDD